MTVNNPTDNYNWTMPTIDGSSGAWDTILNLLIGGDGDETNPGIDEVIGLAQAKADAALPVAGGVMTGELDLLTERYTLVTTATSGTVTLDLETGNFFVIVPSAPVTIAYSNPVGSGEVGFICIEFTNGASQTITWDGAETWPGGVEPTLTAGIDLVTGYTRDGGTTWRMNHASSNSS